MKTGQYNEKKIDYSKYATFKFVPHIFNPLDFPNVSCGAAALSTLTGIPPKKVIKSLGNKNNHTSDKQMLNFLRRHGFSIKELTKCRMTRGQSRLNLSNYIKDNHILLISQLFLKGEGSWSIVTQSKLWHQGEILNLSGLDFVNRPILSAYCLTHKKYNI